MAKHRCDYCGVYFDLPAVHHYREHLGEHRFREYTEASCPICGSDSFQDATNCPQCSAPMPAGQHHLCNACRLVLKQRFIFFADALTADEEQQLDDWLDGDTITNRRNWK